jgi:hypothetical protein
MPGPCSLLKYYKAVFVGTVTEVKEEAVRCRFRVTEAFEGVKGDYVDLDEFPSGTIHFKLGEQYLVFAVPCVWERAGSRCLTSMPCSGTRPLEYAVAILEQLRAEKSGRRVAAVYGTLERTLEENEGIWEEGYRRPLPNILVRLQSDKKSFETRTDEYGAYAFDRLPPGKYQVSADLLPNLALGEQIGNLPVPPFELPLRSCFENNLYALPTGRITGRVIGPDGKPLRLAFVDLCRASRYKEGKPGLHSLQGKGRPLAEWKPFEFYHLPADDYVLLFNSANKEEPDAPFQRTFYPNASDLESSQLIHLAEGQQILNADIHVSNPLPTRHITLRLAWDGRTPQHFYPPQVIVKASKGMEPYPFKNGQDTYTLNLLLSARYTIHAEAFCRMGTTGKAETSAVTIDSGDLSVSEVTLTFDKGECIRK